MRHLERRMARERQQRRSVPAGIAFLFGGVFFGTLAVIAFLASLEPRVAGHGEELPFAFGILAILAMCSCAASIFAFTGWKTR